MRTTCNLPTMRLAAIVSASLSSAFGVYGFTSTWTDGRTFSKALSPSSKPSLVVLKATEKLVFGADYLAISDPFPEGTTMDAALEFLFQEETRNLLFCLGGDRAISTLETTNELVELWQQACDHFGYDQTKPSTEDLMVEVESIVKFPGMKLITTTASGVFVRPSDTTERNEYHAFLVADQQRTEGLKPSIWVFNKLTGASKKEQGVFGKPSGNAKSVIKVIQGDDQQLSISFDVKLEITVEFPSVLMKILPMSKEKMQDSAGKSIQKAISKDVDLAIQATRAAFPPSD